jgi:hypothetical protein
LYFSNPPYTKCQTQIEILTKNLEGEIFAKQGKRLLFSPKLNRYVERCKLGNSPGACFEMFASVRKFMREVRNFDHECYADLASVGEIKSAMSQTMALMVQVAWGESPPPGPDRRFRWFEPADLVLFCDLRDSYRNIYGEEEFLNFQNQIYGTLPGEEPVFEEGKCVNCQYRKGALKLLPPTEIWRRSLFSTPCSAYR